jgi:hypothetical protein
MVILRVQFLRKIATLSQEHCNLERQGMHKRVLECLTCGANFRHSRGFNDHVSFCQAVAHATTLVNVNDLPDNSSAADPGSDNSSADNTEEDPFDTWQTEEDVADENSTGDDLTLPVENQEADVDTDADDESELSSSDGTEPDAEENPQSYLLSLKERELIKFLALVERGEGMSTAKSEEFLSYIKTFNDERAQLLPRKMKTCWLRVDKVGFRSWYYNLFCNRTFK